MPSKCGAVILSGILMSGVALIGGPNLTVGGWLVVMMLGVMFSIFVVMLLPVWDLPPRSCIVRPVGGVCASGFMATHNGWDTMLSLDKAGWDSKAKQLDEVSEEGDGGVLNWFWLVSNMCLELNLVTSPICSCTCILTYLCDLPI